MRRDVTGLRIDKRPNNVARSNGINHVTVQVAPKIAVERVETNDSEVDDHNAKGIVVEDGHEKQDVLGVKSTNYEPGFPDGKSQKAEALRQIEKKLISPVKPASGSATTGTLQTSPSIPMSPSLAAKKHNSVVSDDGYEAGDTVLNGAEKTDDSHSSMTAKISQPISPLMSMKTMHPDHEKYHDEDNFSVASSAATSVRTIKSRITVPVAPTFKSVERLSRRKEYYMKLEEKHKALEAEKLEYAARTKEEEEAAIKQLRKSMAYKANPVPSFYREGPPPKVELKKLPVTRAKSPNLTRRKSCSDAPKSSQPEKAVCDRAKRHSIGVYKHGSITPSTPKNKDVNGGRTLVAGKEGSSSPTAMKNKNMPGRQNSNQAKNIKDHPKQVKETSKAFCAVEQKGPDISVVEEVTKPDTVAEHVADIAVVEETNKTPQAMIDQMSRDITTVEEAGKASPSKAEQRTADIVVEI